MDIISRLTKNRDIINSYVSFRIDDNSLCIYFQTFTVRYTWAQGTKYNVTIYDLNEQVLFNCLINNATKETFTTRSILGPTPLSEFFDEISINNKINIILLYEEFRKLNKVDNDMDLAINAFSEISFTFNKVEELDEM